MSYSKYDRREEKIQRKREKHTDEKHAQKYDRKLEKLNLKRCRYLVREEKIENKIRNHDPLMAHIFDVVEESRARPNGKSPFVDEIKVIKDIEYKRVGDTILYMDIYLPSRPVSEKLPVVMDIPGGGWVIHNRNRRDGYARLYAVDRKSVV